MLLYQFMIAGPKTIDLIAGSFPGSCWLLIVNVGVIFGGLVVMAPSDDFDAQLCPRGRPSALLALCDISLCSELRALGAHLAIVNLPTLKVSQVFSFPCACIIGLALPSK